MAARRQGQIGCARCAPALFALALLACTGGDGGDRDGGALGGGDGDPAPIFGEPGHLIAVTESEWQGDEPTVRGRVAAAFTIPGSASVLTETMREGNCRLLQSRVSRCESCEWFCEDGSCRPYPTYRSAGRISVEGLAAPVSLRWMERGGYEAHASPPDDDLFTPGDPITASAPGAALGGFTVSARAVAPIAPALDGPCGTELRLVKEGATTITWDAPQPGTRVRLLLTSPNDAHGLPPHAVVECEGPDTGSMRIGAALTAAFPAAPTVDTCVPPGCAVAVDCPPATLTRYAQGLANAGAETVALRVQAELEFHAVLPEE
jgi:hypothetical protein